MLNKPYNRSLDKKDMKKINHSEEHRNVGTIGPKNSGGVSPRQHRIRA
jgi:hypothetical protein